MLYRDFRGGRFGFSAFADCSSWGPLRGSLSALLLCSLIGWASLAAAQAETAAVFANSTTGATAGHAEYALQAGDLISVTVYEEEGLSAEVLVRPDGGISFPLIGDLSVAGKSAAMVKAQIETTLAEFIPGASVTVAVLQTAGNRVFVVGKVNAPGAYPIYRPLDVMQALALAGGTAQFAELDDIRILRRGPDGRQQVLEFEYSEVVRGRNLEQNRLLISGDTIVVP